jgi:peroxiredoxin
MKKNTLVMGLAAATLALAGSAIAWADDKPKVPDSIKDQTKEVQKEAEKQIDKTKKDVEKNMDKADKKGVKVGEAAPSFTLKDTAGKEHALADLTKGGDKIVVIQWFNPECPFVVKHYGKAGNTFNDLYTKYKDKGVVFLGINSGAEGKQGAGLEKNQKFVKDWKIEYPILMDMSGTVGKQYDAKRTPEMFIIGKDGKVAYHGAIDDDSKTEKPGSTNYVAKALDELLAGQTVTKAETQPYGCSVKY